jgi:hypothetical protein
MIVGKCSVRRGIVAGSSARLDPGQAWGGCTRRFQGEQVLLSACGYEACTFVGCKLVIDGRAIHLVDNSFVDYRWLFQGCAANTLPDCPVDASGFQPAIPVLSPVPPPSTATPGHGTMPRPATSRPAT